MSSYKEGQTHQLLNALEAQGFTPDHLTKLGQFKDLSLIREVLDDRAEIRLIEYLVVDLDADPFVPNGYSVLEHKKGGQFKYSPTKVKLYLAEGQKSGKVMVGNELHKELENQPVYNANLLDFLYKKENQRYIPEEWKGKVVFFWGTIYRHSTGHLFVRCLYWIEDEWNCDRFWLGRGWTDNYPSVVSVS